MYDAGTDSGTTYLSPDFDTNPQENIAKVTTASGPFMNYSTEVGTFTIKRISVASPELIQPVNNSTNNVSTDFFSISGSLLGNTTHVQFGGDTYSSQSPSDWHSGYFTRTRDTELRFYPPQGRTPRSYSFRAYSGGLYTNSVTLKLIRNTTPHLAALSAVKAGTTTYLFGSVGTGVSNNTLMQLCFSWSTLPTVQAGFVDLGIGDQWQQLYFASVNLADSTTGATSWALGANPSGHPVLMGRRVYYQCIQADLNRPETLFPLKTTVERSILYN